MNIGCLGTSRFRKNWPPSELKNLSHENVNFNDFYWMIDENNTLVARWQDNGLVFVVSTCHRVGHFRQLSRKRPRKTIKNAKHIDAVWATMVLLMSVFQQ